MNKLEHLDTFQDILAHYKISEQGKRTLAETKLALLAAPSSAGRNTIIRELLKSDEYHFIVSDTTRKPRENDGVMEQNGVEYWFRSEAEVLDDLRAGNFLEAAIIHGQQVSGISIRELEQARRENKVALTDVEIVGTRNIVAAKSDVYALFILPPSFEIWMQRMDGRGIMPAEEKRRRLESAVTEFIEALDKDYYQFVINDDFHHSVSKIHAIVYDNMPSEDQAAGAVLAHELRDATKRWLGQN